MLRAYDQQSGPYMCRACRSGLYVVRSRCGGRAILTVSELAVASTARPLAVPRRRRSLTTSACVRSDQKPTFGGGFGGGGGFGKFGTFGQFGAMAGNSKPEEAATLLPHELEARKKAMAKAPVHPQPRAAPPSRWATNPATGTTAIRSRSAGGQNLSPHEMEARRRAMERTPSHPTQAASASRRTINPARGTNATRTRPAENATLQPHEREARRKVAADVLNSFFPPAPTAERATNPANGTPTTKTRPAEDAILLPHELEAHKKAVANTLGSLFSTASATEEATNSTNGTTTAKARPADDAILLPHELEARKKAAAKTLGSIFSTASSAGWDTNSTNDTTTAKARPADDAILLPHELEARKKAAAKTLGSIFSTAPSAGWDTNSVNDTRSAESESAASAVDAPKTTSQPKDSDKPGGFGGFGGSGGFGGFGGFGNFGAMAKSTADSSLLPHELKARKKAVKNVPSPSSPADPPPKLVTDSINESQAVKFKSVVADVFTLDPLPPQDPTSKSEFFSSETTSDEENRVKSGFWLNANASSSFWQNITKTHPLQALLDNKPEMSNASSKNDKQSQALQATQRQSSREPTKEQSLSSKASKDKILATEAFEEQSLPGKVTGKQINSDIATKEQFLSGKATDKQPPGKATKEGIMSSEMFNEQFHSGKAADFQSFSSKPTELQNPSSKATEKLPLSSIANEELLRSRERHTRHESMAAPTYTNAPESTTAPDANTGKSRFDDDRPVRDKKSKKPSRPRSRHSSYDEDEDDGDRWNEMQERKWAKEERQRAEAEREEPEATPIFIPEFISTSGLAKTLGKPVNEFISDMLEMGFENITSDTVMTGETASLVAMEYGFNPTVDDGSTRDLRPAPVPEDLSSVPSRPPVVTIMGHVDHGKTTLLDYLRKSSITEQEHGGITQHIGAFVVGLSSGKKITFLDTPGHAAFLSMRQRGANITDIVVLVVAADDSVKPQTLEALKHIRGANVPFIVAINKVDKPDARVEQVKNDLARNNIEIEDFGGDVQVVCVSGKTGQGMAELEENIIALSEILDVRAEPDIMAEGWLLESSVKQDGRTATVLVKRGTLRVGDFVVAGKTWARIRKLRNEAGEDISEAPPGTPAEILGWRQLPSAGDMILQAPDEDAAKTAIEYRLEMEARLQHSTAIAEQEQEQREKEAAEALAAEAAERGEDLVEDKKPGSLLKQTFIVKADVASSAEAVTACIMEQGTHEVELRVLRSSAGRITEQDVDLAAASGGIIVNFNTAIWPHIKRRAEEARVRILDHSIIYKMIEDVRVTLTELLPPLVTQRVVGEAEILQVFSINIRKRVMRNIAGCRVRNGVVKKGSLVKVLRKGEVLFDGKIDTMKQGKKDSQEVSKGTECGLGVEDFEEFEARDLLQTYEIVEEKRTL